MTAPSSAADPCAARCFSGPAGDEHFIILHPPAGGDFAGQLAALEKQYAAALQARKLDGETAVFRRLFVSDAINQAPLYRASPLVAEAPENPVAVSVIEQRPLNGSKLALLAYHVSGAPLEKRRLAPRHLQVTRNGLRHLWSTQLWTGSRAASSPEDVQTNEIFGELIEALSRQKAGLAGHCVRTWLYLKDVDVFYRGMVNARRALFVRHGLTENTHYIASTGIEGGCENQFDLVVMDAYSIPDLRPGQMSYLNDYDYLCATKDYNVTFERGTRIAFADRAHYYISGTASIDRFGDTVHRGDVMKQLDLALVNIEALLRSGGAALSDMMYVIVYLRDAADTPPVAAELRRRFPGLPMVIVEGAVCRPEWLIEIEGVGAKAQAFPGMPGF